MKNVLIYLSAVLFFVFSTTEIYSCTSAIITGKLTPDGRPLLWKHRDTGEDNNRLEFFKGDKHNFIGLVNSPDEGGVVWIGTNSAGFSIMNTASYNLKDDDVKEMDQEGVFMFKALSVCSSLEEFEEFINNYPRPMRVEANFGVIDSKGGAAYYEVNNHSFVKLDVNDPKIAPLGYLVYTNFSYTGRFNQGMGYIRYMNANNILSRKSSYGDITPHWIFNNLSRSFYHSLLDIDLSEKSLDSGWFIDMDFIPRRSSTASVIVQGVKNGESPDLTTMWTILGYPPTGVAIPAWVGAGGVLPSIAVKSDNTNNAYACDMALELKYRIFPIERGSGKRYFKFNLIYNREKTGYMQQLSSVDQYIFRLFKEPIERWRRDGIDKKELQLLYRDLDDSVIGAYSGIY